uniref:RRM domain-containing protein n=2 Tax=Parascaris univalens TaxID=6257 RepID=A0A915A1J1_PARUN
VHERSDPLMWETSRRHELRQSYLFARCLKSHMEVEDIRDEEEGLRFEEEENVDERSGQAALGDHICDDTDMDFLRNRMKEIEEEAAMLRRMQLEVEREFNAESNSPPTSTFASIEEKIEADGRSIYIGNVDYGATAEELEAHFHGCGCVNRVTILTDKFTGHPKGFAYMEFAEKESVQTAMVLNETLFHGRQIKVSPKRTNRPGLSTTNRRPRGRGHGGGRVIVKYVYAGAHRRPRSHLSRYRGPSF